MTDWETVRDAMRFESYEGFGLKRYTVDHNDQYRCEICDCILRDGHRKLKARRCKACKGRHRDR